MQNDMPLWKKICHILRKSNIYIPYDPEILLLGSFSIEIKATQMSINSKQNLLYPNNGKLYSNKKISASTQMSLKKNHTKWKKTDVNPEF